MSGEVTAAVSWKFLSGLLASLGIGAGFAAFVVMSMTRPRDDREWRVALVSTLFSSFGGGCAFIMHFELSHWAQSPIGLIAIAGILFASGLPGWALVRWTFNEIRRRDDKHAGIVDVVREVKEIV
jgi:hypothetical protein